MTNEKTTGRNSLLALALSLTGLLIYGCGSSNHPASTGGTGGAEDTGGSSGSDTGGKTGTGGSSATGGSSGSTGGAGGSATGGSGDTGGSGGAGTGGSGDTGGSGGSTEADAGTKADGGGSTGTHEVTADNALVKCKTTAKYRLPGASPADFCAFYEKYCPYAPSQPPRLITPPTPATSAYFQDYNDCIMRYTMAPPESQSCRAGQLCGTNYMEKPIGQGCTHATGHFDPPCYAK
jgi:hypothetical protein